MFCPATSARCVALAVADAASGTVAAGYADGTVAIAARAAADGGLNEKVVGHRLHGDDLVGLHAVQGGAALVACGSQTLGVLRRGTGGALEAVSGTRRQLIGRAVCVAPCASPSGPASVVGLAAGRLAVVATGAHGWEGSCGIDAPVRAVRAWEHGAVVLAACGRGVLVFDQRSAERPLSWAADGSSLSTCTSLGLGAGADTWTVVGGMEDGHLSVWDLRHGLLGASRRPRHAGAVRWVELVNGAVVSCGDDGAVLRTSTVGLDAGPALLRSSAPLTCLVLLREPPRALTAAVTWTVVVGGHSGALESVGGVAL
jgi:hypothetical protein